MNDLSTYLRAINRMSSAFTAVPVRKRKYTTSSRRRLRDQVLGSPQREPSLRRSRLASVGRGYAATWGLDPKRRILHDREVFRKPFAVHTEVLIAQGSGLPAIATGSVVIPRNPLDICFWIIGQRHEHAADIEACLRGISEQAVSKRFNKPLEKSDHFPAGSDRDEYSART